MSQIYTEFDFFIMFVKLFSVFATLINYGAIFGIFLVLIFYNMYYSVLRTWFSMDKLSSLDEFFLLDNEKNRANIITVVRLEKFSDYEKL
jgi:hypothetical protein